jgi:hypothetical protein
MVSKKIAIMQPYFLPYLGYFQLMNVVDEFVIYDNIQFSKRGWIHRNRILQNGQPAYVSLPLKKDSDFLDINQRFLSDSFKRDKEKLLFKIKGTYKKAPQFEKVFPIIEQIFNFNETNLFEYIYNSLEMLKDFLNIETKLIRSSEIDIDHNLKSQEKVIAISKALKAEYYINPEGGKDLYAKNDFNDKQVNLQFHIFFPEPYQQFSSDFVSYLSIIDLLMLCDLEEIKYKLNYNFKID